MNLTLRGLCLCVVITSAPVFAAEENLLYKCEDNKGTVSIQSSPCPPGSQQIWKRDPQAFQAPSVTSSSPAKAPAASPPVAPPPPTRPAQAAMIPMQEGETPHGPDACEKAQEFAVAIRDKPWLQLSDEQTRRLYGWVSEQCRGAGDSR